MIRTELRQTSAQAVAGFWKRGLVLAALAILLGALMLLHANIPQTKNVGSLVETFLPWFGLFIPLLLIGALLRRSASAVVALLLPVVVWLNLFGGVLVDKSHAGADLIVASHNVGADNSDPVGTAGDLTTVATDNGPLAVYVAHLGSVGVNPRAGFSTYQRDAGAQALANAIAAEEIEKVVLLGDLNGTMDDRAFDGITSQMQSVQDTSGAGFGFSWPAKFPVVRIDQILVRGVEPENSWVLPATGSDHLPVAAGISW